MDWVTADQKVRENLIMIMNRSLIPIEFSSAHILMNLDSFVKVRDKFVLLSIIVYNCLGKKCFIYNYKIIKLYKIIYTIIYNYV